MAKRKELKQEGLGNKPKKTEPLTAEEENRLWEAGQLGANDPTALLNTMWFFNTKLFGLRATDENRQLQWGDISVKCDENDDEYLEYNERKTKTRDGNTPHTRAFKPKIFPNKTMPERCPLKLYKEYVKRRPSEMLSDNSPFYLAVFYNRPPECQQWYKKQPLGVNLLRSMMKRMAAATALPGKKTNHSVRKTMCTNLLHAGVAPTNIIQLSGHKNVASLSNYATASRQQQHAMCNILMNPNTVEEPLQPASLSQNYTSNTTMSTAINSTHDPRTLFSGAVVHGGVFYITVNNGTDTCQHHHHDHHKRRRIVYSDSDTE